MAGGYVKVTGHKRSGGTVSMSKQFHTEPYTRKDGKKVKQSKSQYNSAYERKGAVVKGFSRYVNNLKYTKKKKKV